MTLDPEFAPFPYPEVQLGAKMADAVFKALNRPAYQRQPDWLREDIAGLDADIDDYEKSITSIQKEIPALQLELLKKQRDLAECKLARYEKQAELAKATGGAQ